MNDLTAAKARLNAAQENWRAISQLWSNKQVSDDVMQNASNEQTDALDAYNAARANLMQNSALVQGAVGAASSILNEFRPFQPGYSGAINNAQNVERAAFAGVFGNSQISQFNNAINNFNSLPGYNTRQSSSISAPSPASITASPTPNYYSPYEGGNSGSNLAPASSYYSPYEGGNSGSNLAPASSYYSPYAGGNSGSNLAPESNYYSPYAGVSTQAQAYQSSSSNTGGNQVAYYTSSSGVEEVAYVNTLNTNSNANSTNEYSYEDTPSTLDQSDHWRQRVAQKKQEEQQRQASISRIDKQIQIEEQRVQRLKQQKLEREKRQTDEEEKERNTTYHKSRFTFSRTTSDGKVYYS